MNKHVLKLIKNSFDCHYSRQEGKNEEERLLSFGNKLDVIIFNSEKELRKALFH